MLAWFRARWSWLVAAAGAVLVLAWAWQRRQRLSQAARARVAELQKEIGAKEAVRAHLLLSAEDETLKTEALRVDIEAAERRIVALNRLPVRGLTRDQIIAKLRRLGY